VQHRELPASMSWRIAHERRLPGNDGPRVGALSRELWDSRAMGVARHEGLVKMWARLVAPRDCLR
jgi:hypothetical protein